MIEIAWMRSARPGTPGRRQQMSRTMSWMSTPAWLATYSSSISGRSTRLLILTIMRACRPVRAWPASRRIRAMSPDRRSVGATSRWWKPAGRVYGEVRLDAHSPGTVRLHLQPLARGRGRHARGPDHRLARGALARHGDAVFVDLIHAVSQPDLHAQLLEPLLRGPGKVLRIRAQTPVRPMD